MLKLYKFRLKIGLKNLIKIKITGVKFTCTHQNKKWPPTIMQVNNGRYVNKQVSIRFYIENKQF